VEQRTKTFEECFVEAINEGLKVLGDSGKQMIFFYLENNYSVKKDEIAKKPEAFATGIEKIFHAGALVIERLIVESLYSKLGLRYEERKDFSFGDYVKQAKEQSK
jgi:hypothetical protein